MTAPANCGLKRVRGSNCPRATTAPAVHPLLRTAHRPHSDRRPSGGTDAWPSFPARSAALRRARRRRGWAAGWPGPAGRGGGFQEGAAALSPVKEHSAKGAERSARRPRLHPRPGGPGAPPGTRRPPPLPPARRVSRPAAALPLTSPHLTSPPAAGPAPSPGSAGSRSGLGQRPARAPQLPSDARGQEIAPSPAAEEAGKSRRAGGRYSTPPVWRQLTRGGSAFRSRRRRARPPATAPGGAGGGASCSIALRLLPLLLLRGPPPPPAGPIPLRPPGPRRHVPGPALREPHGPQPRPRGWAPVGPRTTPARRRQARSGAALRRTSCGWSPASPPARGGSFCCAPLPPRQPAPLRLRSGRWRGLAGPRASPASTRATQKKASCLPLRLTRPPRVLPSPIFAGSTAPRSLYCHEGGRPSPKGGGGGGSLHNSCSGVGGVPHRTSADFRQ